MQKKTQVYILIIIILLSCTSIMLNGLIKQKSHIKGRWVLQNDFYINYPEIDFENDSTVIFFSVADTLYAFKYLFIDLNTIILLDIKGNTDTIRINKLNSDSLVFDGLREKTGPQIYIRD